MLEEICYKSNYLIKVIARLDLLTPIKSLMQEIHKNISDDIMLSFPIAEPRKKIGKELLISPDELREKRIEEMEWNYHGKIKEKRCAISPDAIILDYKEYTSYETLRDEFIRIVTLFFNNYKNLQGRRLGLRYINEINLGHKNPLNWQEFINNKMLYLFDFFQEPDKLSRVFHNLEFNFGEFNLKYQFGMHNPDYPAKIKRKIFILDLDAYYEGPQNLDEISKSLNDFHSKIQELFEMSITDKLRELLNEER